MRDTPVTSFPRKDNAYKSKSSLDFDMMRSKIYIERKGRAQEEIILWFTFCLVGFMTGVLAFMLTYCEDKLTEWRS
jgi:hypothetical protein